MDASVIASNLLAPQILFFVLGALAVLAKSDLEIPQPVSRGLSFYLLVAIGLRGGAELAHAGVTAATVAPLAVGAFAGAALPVVSFRWLRRKLSAADAAAVAAAYGSVSAVTFISACSFLEDRGTPWSGHMVAAMALMESPAILVGVALARASDPERRGAPIPLRALAHEAFLNGPVVLLLGSLAIGLVAGPKGWQGVEPFVHAPFKGVLCLFLLDMGIAAARRLSGLRAAGPGLALYAVAAPLVHGAVGVAAAHALGLGPGDSLLLTVLFASASYIAVPAALRVALPQADPGVYLPPALAVTFPLNIAVGIPLWMAVIDRLRAA